MKKIICALLCTALFTLFLPLRADAEDAAQSSAPAKSEILLEEIGRASCRERV